MAYVTATGTEHGKGTRLASYFAEIGAFAALFGAAVRAARAVEAGHQPDMQDLRMLGITWPLAGLR